MSHPQSFDPNIPVLTEILQDARPATGQDGPLEESAVDDWGSRESGGQESGLKEWGGQEWRGQEWDMLERRLSARILQQLQGRVDVMLEQRIKDCMADVLQHAMADLTDHIRHGLQDTLEKIVASAVSQELLHLQALKK